TVLVKAPILERGKPVREIVAALAEANDGFPTLRDAIVDRLIPSHGLEFLLNLLEGFAEVKLVKRLNTADSKCWPQIKSAFEVRHLVEHRDGRVDAHFRDAVGSVWAKTSWGDQKLAGMKKVAVRETDVVATYRAMMRAATTVGIAIEQA